MKSTGTNSAVTDKAPVFCSTNSPTREEIVIYKVFQRLPWLGRGNEMKNKSMLNELNEKTQKQEARVDDGIENRL